MQKEQSLVPGNCLSSPLISGSITSSCCRHMAHCLVVRANRGRPGRGLFNSPACVEACEVVCTVHLTVSGRGIKPIGPL